MIIKAILKISTPFLVLFFSTFSYAAEVTLAWDASSGGPQGYSIYYGTSPGVFTDSVNVGNVTEYTLSGLQADVTYYFVTRAYNNEGESGNSNEVQWIYETADTTPPVVSISGPASTSNPVINLSGTATDSNGVSEVTWVSDQGGSGNAQGTNNWTISGITLSDGHNIITVSASDPSGNVGSSQISVTFNPPAPGDTITAEFGNTAGSDYTGSIQDTFTNVGEPNINYSSDSDKLIIYTWPTNTNANPVLIKWDLTDIPINATILSADLQLYLNDYSDSGGDNLYEISAHKIVNKNPDISQCSWNTYDGVNSWTGGANGGQNDLATAEDTKMVDKTVGYKQWDVTQMVKDWVAGPSANFGMMLLSDQGSNKASADTNRIFVPTENVDANKRPKLIVTYSVGDPINNDPPAAPTGIQILLN